MSTRHALSAAFVSAGALARTAVSVTAESNQRGSSAGHQTAPGADIPLKHADANHARPEVDLARAIAVMERYHRMSQEALSANTGSSSEQSDATDGNAPADAGSDDDSGAGPKTFPSVSDPPVAAQNSHNGKDVGTLEVLSPKLSSGVPLSAAGSDKNAGGAPPAIEPVSVEKNVAKRSEKKKKRRISAERLYTNLNAEGSACVPHVIIGGGTAAWSAVQAIRRRDPSAAVLVVTEEAHYPYNRTPLSKELWAPDSAGLFTSEVGTKGAVEYTYADVSNTSIQTASVDGDTSSETFSRVSILRGTAVERLDVDSKTVHLSNGHAIQYEKLLLATGGLPRSAGNVCDALETNEGVRESVSVFRTLDDFRKLRSELGPPGSSVAVVGAGFLGTELAVAMAAEGRKVSLLCAEPGVLYKVLPRYLSQYLARKLVSLGVEVVESAVVVDAQTASEDDRRVVLTVGGSVEETPLTPVDKVVVCTGIIPRTELASEAGLEVDKSNGGIVVNDQMSAEADVYVAGDVASFWDRALGRRRIEHWDHAVVSGRIAGDRMAGGDSRYGLQSMFWSNLDNVGVSFSAVGLVDHELATTGVWNLDAEGFEHAPSANLYREGVVWYLKDNVIVGAILWNIRDREALAVARKSIATKRRLSDDESAKEVLPLAMAEHSCVVRTEALDVDIV